MAEPKVVKTNEETFENIRQLKVALKLVKDLTPNQRTFLSKTIAPGLNDSQLAQFLYRANICGLDPLNNEVYAYVQDEKLVMIAGRDGKRKVASQTGQLGAIQTGVVYVSPEGIKVESWASGAKLWGAEAKVWRKGFDQPFTSSVLFSEYGRIVNVWKSKPETMLRKVAESQALSAAFPEVLGGIYDESEDFKQGRTAEVEIPEDARPATDEQKATLTSLKVEFDEKIDRGSAAQLIADATAKK